jgi:type I restriction enzyme S subunit
MEWREAKLGDVIHIKHGYPFESEHFSFIEGKYTVLTPGNFYETGGFLERPDKDRYYTGSFPKDYILKKNDLIIAMTEQTYGLLGSPALIPIDNRFLHNQRLGLVQIKDESVLRKKYLYYLFFTKRIREEISNGASGTKIRHTAPERIYRCKTLFPPLPVQEKIAAVLSTYDDLIESNNRRIAILEKMTEEIYKEWFVRMRFPGHKKVKFHKGVPEGWEKVKVGDAFQFTGGGTPSTEEGRYWKDGNINWYTPSDITAGNGMFLFGSKTRCTEEGVRASSAKLFPPYSVMMTSRATIGAVAINTTYACTNQGFITCYPNERYPLAFLYHWLRLNKANFDILSSGATFNELIKSTFRKISIITPPKDVVSRFQAIEQPLFNKTEALLRKKTLLNHSRDLLLARLITGKLSVEGLDIKFPPSMRSPELVEGREADG